MEEAEAVYDDYRFTKKWDDAANNTDYTEYEKREDLTEYARMDWCLKSEAMRKLRDEYVLEAGHVGEERKRDRRDIWYLQSDWILPKVRNHMKAQKVLWEYEVRTVGRYKRNGISDKPKGRVWPRPSGRVNGYLTERAETPLKEPPRVLTVTELEEMRKKRAEKKRKTMRKARKEAGKAFSKVDAPEVEAGWVKGIRGNLK